MSDDFKQRPKLRPVEAFPVRDGDQDRFAVRDPSGLSEPVLTMSQPALYLLSLMDGTRTLDDLRRDFQARFNANVASSTLSEMIENLDASYFLDGPRFDAYFDRLVSDYKNAPTRQALHAPALGSREEARAYMADLLPRPADAANGERTIVGLVAPHLDYPRGRPCYARAYGVLWRQKPPARCVVLGTNHFGRSTAAVATRKPFETPFGVTAVDTDFLDDIERVTGHDLCAHEFDHLREHSVELQVMCLQHIWGAESFRIVPVLCPDPCGPTGTRPIDGRGIDLTDFTRALRERIQADPGDTLVIAGADLSHVGSQFGDTHELDSAFLSYVEQSDRAALSFLQQSQPERFVSAVARNDNPTRVCSAGCIYVTAAVLRNATANLLQYHQAFDRELQICVTCAAVTYTR